MKKLLLPILLSTFALALQAQTYCAPTYSTGCTYGDDIEDVFIGSFQDTATGCSTGNYNVQTSDTVFIQQTAPTSISFTSNWSTQYFALWIDFNDDGDFDDSGEHLWSSPTNAWSTTTGSITIPSTVSLGSYRLRVRSNYSAAITAAQSCSSFIYGEVHDYTVTVTTPPACPAPVFASLTASDTTATLSWTSADTLFTVDYGIAGSSNVPTSITVTDTFVTVSGLSPNTSYEFFIETNCSAAGNGYSQTVGPYTVKTLCTALSTPVYEGFDNDSTGGFSNPNAPSCWYYLEESGAAGYGYIDNATWSVSPRSGANYYYLYNSFDASYEALVSPAIIGLDSGTKQMEFYAANTSWSGGNALYIGTVSNTSSLSTLDIMDTVFVPNGGNWTQFTIYFDASTGYNMMDDHIAIVSSDSTTYSAVYIEDISITNAPDCLPPSAIAVGSVLQDSAQISYTTNGIQTYLEYGPPGFVQGTGTSVTVSGSPAWLTGLDSNTTYDVYVVQMCADSSISTGLGPVTFKTMTCSPSNMCTFTIELTDSWGDGWNGALVEVINAQGGVEYELGANFLTGSSYTETISVCTGGSYTIVVSDAGFYPSEIGLNVVSGGATIATYTNSSSTTLGTQMAAFQASCNTLCPNPKDLIYTAGKNDVNFSFNPNGNTGTFVYEWGPQGFVQATGSMVSSTDSTTSSNFTITGLSSNTCYDIILIADCGGNGTSDTLGPISFCTNSCDTTDLCTYTMSMYDTYGDGWNGATVDLYYNGAYGQTFGPAFTTGDSLIVDFEVCAGTEIAVVNASQGTYPSEVYYTLSNTSGSQNVSVSAGNFNAGAVDTVMANCVTPSCPTPTNVAVANMGSTFADISWTGGNGSYVFHYTAFGATNTMMGISTSAMASMTGLQPLTTYNFDVAEVCTAGDTSLRMNYQFTTDSCSAINVGNPNYNIDSISATFADITFTWAGAAGYTSYFINFGDGTNGSGTGASQTHTYTANGQYTAVLKLYGDCDTTSQQIFVSIQGIGFEEHSDLSALVVYPNPTQGILAINGTLDQASPVAVRIVNYLGQVISADTFEAQAGGFEKTYDLSAAASGTYVIEIETAKGLLQKTVVVRH